jgi:hypothetical protein
MRGGIGGGEGLAHEHQELKARPGVGLGRRGVDRRWVSHGGRGGGGGGACRWEVSRRGGRSSPGPTAAAGGEEATGVVGLVGGGAEGRA